MTHEIVRLKHEVVRRRLTVRDAVSLTPHMRRLILGGEALEGFHSPAADDHVKIFVPGPEGLVGRDYTPRRYDAATHALTIDFALHDAGPATAWARHAQPGDEVEIAGPRGSAIVPADFDWWWLIGDETALPAIGRRVEELPAGTPVTTVVAVPGPEDEQSVETGAAHRAVWIHRSAAAAADPAPFLAALRALPRPDGDGYIWIAAETHVARALRAWVLDDLGHPAAWMKASGYWTEGRPDASEKFGR